MNIEAATLKLLVENEDREEALEVFGALSRDYFTQTFYGVYKLIMDYYNSKGTIPTFPELETYRQRDAKTIRALNMLKLVDTKGISLSLAAEELANQAAQNLCLEEINSILDNITLMSKEEILDKVAMIPLTLEDSFTQSNLVYDIKDVSVFKTKSEAEKERMYCGICDEWDFEAGGYYKQEFILLGGRRGSGKSIFCANLVKKQHDQGNVSIYATIEMTYEETFHRILAILASVPFANIRKQCMTEEEKIRIIKAIASLYDGGDVIVEKYLSAPDIDFRKLESELKAKCKVKEEGRIIILDDRQLSLTSLDVQIAKYKAKYGDKLSLVVLDYINQLVMGDGKDMYDWKIQTEMGKQLKNQARKHNICLVSPYQIDESGKARFAQGILDAADLAQLIVIDDKESGALSLQTTKSRSAKDDGTYPINMDWETLTIDPAKRYIEDTTEEEDSSVESSREIQW
jgi:KaiC/GvpD/RAD55 family RecA-like ATPase